MRRNGTIACIPAVPFQSTHLREVRPSQHHQLPFHRDHFNPRTYVRCDVYLISIKFKSLLFQSTHLHEVRLGGAGTYIYVAQFQSTHLREVRPYTYLRVSWQRKYFNPRTYVRCDKIAKLIQYIYMIFQSTHLREVRQLLM